MKGCPKCGDTDIQVMELLQAWKEIETLQKLIKERPEKLLTVREEFVVPASANIDIPALKNEPALIITEPHSCETEWKQKYESIREAYIKTRLEVSGSFGNWSGDTRRRVLEHEISAELGFKV